MYLETAFTAVGRMHACIFSECLCSVDYFSASEAFGSYQIHKCMDFFYISVFRCQFIVFLAVCFKSVCLLV